MIEKQQQQPDQLSHHHHSHPKFSLRYEDSKYLPDRDICLLLQFYWGVVDGGLEVVVIVSVEEKSMQVKTFLLP